MRICAWEDGCESYCEGNTLFCGTHNKVLRDRRKKAAQPPKEWKSIKKVSDKRAIENPIYSEALIGFCAISENQI